MTTYSVGYPSSANALACTLASLASSTTAGRSCAAWSNKTALYTDIVMTVRIKSGSSTPTGPVYIYPFISADGTHFSGSSAESVGTDAAVTLDTATNLLGPIVMNFSAAATTEQVDIPFNQYLAGLPPQMGGVVIVNATGFALDATAGSSTVTWTAGNQTSV